MIGPKYKYRIMKAEVFLTFPCIFTGVNLLFAFRASKVQAQPVVDRVLSRCSTTIDGTCQDESLYGDISLLLQEDPVQSLDPNLQLLPGTNKLVYVRPDIATFYGAEPGSMQEQEPAFQGQAAKFVNMSPDPIHLYWVDNKGVMTFQDKLGPWEAGGTSSFPGHVFTITEPSSQNLVLGRFHITKGTSVYYYDPFVEYDANDPAQAVPDRAAYRTRNVDGLSLENRQHYYEHQYNRAFASEYKNFTGAEWLTMYPRDPPSHFIWSAEYFGQQHHVQTKETQFFELPPVDQLEQVSHHSMREHVRINLAEYRTPGVMNLTIEAISCAPKAFKIEGFLSEAEVQHLFDIINGKHLERSTTNGHLSSTRTSRTTWVSRHADPVVDAIYRRAADALNLDEALLRDREPDERPDMEFTERINEDLQVVHYDKGQQYTAHHDFGYPKGERNSPSRSINFCMYLNDVPQGGQTTFVRGRSADTPNGIAMTPKKGTAMIFYMVLPDGNLDDLSQHAAMPVLEGEKYFTNLWIWDPHRKHGPGM